MWPRPIAQCATVWRKKSDARTLLVAKIWGAAEFCRHPPQHAAWELQTRCFAKKKKRSRNIHDIIYPKISKKEHQRLEKERKRDMMKLRNLHKAGKWKRILSACDFWFSKANLATDEFMRDELKKNQGWMPIRTLLTFPKFHYWTDAQLLYDAFSSSAAARYTVSFDTSTTSNQPTKRRDASLGRPAILASTDEYNASCIASNDSVGQNTDPTATIGGELPLIADDGKLSLDDSASGDDEDGNRQSSDHKKDATNTVMEDAGSVAEEPYDDDWTDMDYSSDEDEMESSSRILRSLESVPTKGLDDAGKEEASQATIAPQGPEHAFVRHRRVTLDFIEQLEAAQWEEFQEPWDSDSESDFDYNDYLSNQYLFLGDINREMELEALSEEPPKKKEESLVEYKTKRDIRVIRSEDGLKQLCQDIVQSARTASETLNDPRACAVGFDVEYCSLELDIRSTLPAMIQLSSPTENGPVGLIWLDKFANHGRNILSNQSFAPLSTLLADSTILKVGVGATKDAEHLAQWWAVNDKKDMVHFFSGMTDLESELDENVNGKSLQYMCEHILQRRLPKLKGKKQRKDQNRRKEPPSHWRADTLTASMRDYAAFDAASAIDIWMKLHGFQVQSNMPAKKAKKKTKAIATA